MRVLPLAGSYYQMGFEHGSAYAEQIREIAAERVRLCGDPEWVGYSPSTGEVLGFARECLAQHEAYAPHLMEELSGISDSSGVSLAELSILNGYTDFIDTLYAAGKGEAATRRKADNCTAFMVPDGSSDSRQGFLGQTWDMHSTATPYVIMLRIEPEDAPAALIFTITGCVGMIGLNNAGIGVAINNLSGGDGQVGVTWPFVIRRMLEQRHIDDALACLTSANLAGAHNYMLFDGSGNGYNVEAMSSHHHVSPLKSQPVAHTNHCLAKGAIACQRPMQDSSMEDSTRRLDRAQQLLTKPSLSISDLMALTRDRPHICTYSEPPYFDETCGAAIMQPATGKFWAVWGLPSENEFELLQI